MTNFARLVRDVEQRSVRISGLMASGVALLLTAAAALAAAVYFYAAPGSRLSLVWHAALIALPLVASGVAHLAGRMAKHDPAQLLLQVDLRLGLEERL
ncbi:hypothetical protein KJ567_06385, partial [Candidatus Bipolaricaulota bacterium]|nr:hypothetical protein [Candidatus Bipolaricaulota bacterium]